MTRMEMKSFVCGIALIVAIVLLGSMSGLRAQVPTPESVLGHKPGDDYYLANYEDSLGYFQKLAAASDKIRLFNVGKTTEGRDWYIAVISSAENLRNLDKYKDIARRVALVNGLNDDQAHQLARDGKAIVHIDGGIHASEVASAQQTILLAYTLVSGENDPAIRRILDNVILTLWFSINPDGQDMVASWYRRNLGTPYEVSPLPWLYQKYVGHDNNRDAYMNNMIESQVITREVIRNWFPMIVYCHHQSSPFPTRIWAPPFSEPVSSNVHPLMFRWTNLIGTAIGVYLEQHGMPGAMHYGKAFDAWYPGFVDDVHLFRNVMTFWTETGLYRYATPHFYTIEDFPKNYQDLRQQVFYSSPWQGGWWRLVDAVRYQLGASMSVLDTASRYREELIYNRYQAGKEVIEKFTKNPPYAYLIPQQQRDPQSAAALVEKMQFNGVDISQATEPVKVNGKEFPAGTWAIMMDQPFASLIKDLFEPQNYPDLRTMDQGSRLVSNSGPEAPPQLPYDVAGWTLPFQTGVDVAEVSSPMSKELRSKFRVVDKVALPAGSVSGTGTYFVLDHRSNAAFRAVNRVFKAGGKITIANKDLVIGGTQYEPGAFVASGVDAARMQSLASDLALKVQATDRMPESATSLKAPRIGLYASWTGNIDDGWTQWLLEQYEFPHTLLHNAEMKTLHLEDQFDSIVIAELSTNAIMNGHAAGSIPAEYAGGIGEAGLANLKTFVRSGGTLVTLGNSSIFAIDKFKLPVKNVLGELRSLEFFCPGSILRAEVKESSHPVVFGLEPNPAVMFARNPAFEPERDFNGAVLITYPKDDNPLLSGFLLHPEKLQGKAAALDVPYGKGHIILIGFRPQWRCQSWGTYKVLFNSMLYAGGWKPEKPAAPEKKPMP